MTQYVWTQSIRGIDSSMEKPTTQSSLESKSEDRQKCRRMISFRKLFGADKLTKLCDFFLSNKIIPLLTKVNSLSCIVTKRESNSTSTLRECLNAIIQVNHGLRLLSLSWIRSHNKTPVHLMTKPHKVGQLFTQIFLDAVITQFIHV